MAAVTRLGLYGGPRGLYGSFAGKTEQVIVATTALDDEGGSGKYKGPTDWEVRLWLESLFPQKPETPVIEAESREISEEKPRRLEIVNVDASDLEEYATALSKMERMGEIYVEYRQAAATYEADRRKTRQLREMQRMKARVAALVQSYIKRQRDDESVLVLILSEIL